uniref:RRM domain-containing protein n=1 Tax=Leishmania guyanensis TaxID=5670 RepID=A0A1E1J569_LEIGU|nr:Hypothetical protein BN36_3362160 [Leishmania guyanensis]
MRTSARSYVNRITASSATAVAGASPLQHFIGPVSQTYSSPAQYGEPTNLPGSTSPGATAPFQILGSPPQQPQQAEMRVYRDDNLVVPPSLAEVPHEDDNAEEKTLIFQLRGLPFAATRKDVESFLHTVDYDQLDVGTLATGESSGNAFVELHSLRAAEKLGRLHNTVITVAADAGVPVRERPRPRYVEVLAANAAKREQVLRLDARTSRSALPVPRRARARHLCRWRLR